MKTLDFEVVKFCTSNDYSRFHFFNFNRSIDKKHVKKLMSSITKWGFNGAITVIKTSIIDGTEKLYVLEGQHRFTAAKNLGINFNFNIIEIDSKIELAKFIADVNNSSKAWGTNQFISVWADMQIAEYVKMKQVQEETKLQITPLVAIYTGKSDMDDFRKGTMQFPDEAESDIIVSQIMDLNKYLPTKAFCRRAIIKFMRKSYYNHKNALVIFENIHKSMDVPENEVDLTKWLDFQVGRILKTMNKRNKNNQGKVA